MGAMADQVIFSQFDGKGTWTNVYVNVPDARAYSWIGSGVAYTSATDGRRQIGSGGVVSRSVAATLEL